MATCGEYLVRILAAHGIDTVFGIPGVHTVELYRGLGNAPVRHITPRHEQGAGFMADGYARASGRPAACFIITGPGLTNIATALGQAYADSVPVLVISSVNNTHEMMLGEGRLHELPCQRNLMAGLTAFSHTLLRPDELPAVLERAQCVFNSARPRPVHIEIPLDVIVANADHLPARTTATRAAAAPDREAIKAAARLLVCRQVADGVAGRRSAGRAGRGAPAGRDAGGARRHHHQRQGAVAARPSFVARQHHPAAADAGGLGSGRCGARHRHRDGRDRHPPFRQRAQTFRQAHPHRHRSRATDAQRHAVDQHRLRCQDRHGRPRRCPHRHRPQARSSRKRASRP